MYYIETSFIKHMASTYSPPSICLWEESVIEALRQLKPFVLDLSISPNTFSDKNSESYPKYTLLGLKSDFVLILIQV